MFTKVRKTINSEWRKQLNPELVLARSDRLVCVMRRKLDSFHRFADILFATESTTFAELDGFLHAVDDIFEIRFEANVTREEKKT